MSIPRINIIVVLSFSLLLFIGCALSDQRPEAKDQKPKTKDQVSKTKDKVRDLAKLKEKLYTKESVAQALAANKLMELGTNQALSILISALKEVGDPDSIGEIQERSQTILKVILDRKDKRFLKTMIELLEVKDGTGREEKLQPLILKALVLITPAIASQP